MSSKQSKPIHILFVGAGAVGCFYASRLHSPESQVYVSLVCRSNFKAITSNGVVLRTHSFGDYIFTPAATYSSINDAATSSNTPSGGWDYIVVTTKALPDITDDSKDIEPLVQKAVDGKTCIVLIQNGVGVEEPHRTRFPQNPIISAVTIISAEQIEQGVIRQNRWTRISMGPYSDGRAQGDREVLQRGELCVNNLVRLFRDIGRLRDAEPHDEVDLQMIRWHKICINASMNPSSVLSGGQPNASMALDPELRIHLAGTMQEIFDAAPIILGRPFPEHLAKPELILKSNERNTGGRPSMLVDWEAGRPMELEVILGNPVRLARRAGVDLKRVQTLYALLKSAQKRRDEEKTRTKASL